MPLPSEYSEGIPTWALPSQASLDLLCNLHNLLTPGYTRLLRQILKAPSDLVQSLPDLLPVFLQGVILFSQPNPF